MATSTPARRKRGRPSKLTPAVSEKIVTAVRAGNYVETAAEYAGVGYSTVKRWLAEGAADDAPREFRDFRAAVTRARAEAEVRMVAVVQRAALGGAVLKRVSRTRPDGTEETEEQYAAPDGRVALEMMSRAFRARWARTSAVEVTGADGGPIQVEHGRTIAALAERLHALSEAGDGPDVVEGEVVDD